MTENTQFVAMHRDDEVSLRDLILSTQKWINYLLSKWYLILAFGLIGGAVGYRYAASKKPVYSAVTNFVLETAESGGIGQYAGLASMVGIDVGGAGGGLFQGDNILELYKSRTMIENALLSNIEGDGKREMLIDRYINVNKLRERWQKKTELRNITFNPSNKYSTNQEQLLHDSIMGLIVKDINKNYLSVTRPDKKLSIVRVEVKAQDQLFAKAFNDKIVQKVNDFYVNTMTKKSIENVMILQRKADSVRSMMTGAIYRAARVVDATPNLNPTRQAQRAAPVQSAQASADVNKAILPELVRNLELSKIALSKETPLIQVVDKPILPLDKSQFALRKGMMLGALIGALLITTFLFLRRLIKNIVNGPQLSKPI